jgi:hypothetical protein
MPEALRWIQSQLEAADLAAERTVYTHKITYGIQKKDSENDSLDSKQNNPKLPPIRNRFHYTNFLDIPQLCLP